jgi:hypothetical protein
MSSTHPGIDPAANSVQTLVQTFYTHGTRAFFPVQPEDKPVLSDSLYAHFLKDLPCLPALAGRALGPVKENEYTPFYSRARWINLVAGHSPKDLCNLAAPATAKSNSHLIQCRKYILAHMLEVETKLRAGAHPFLVQMINSEEATV